MTNQYRHPGESRDLHPVKCVCAADVLLPYAARLEALALPQVDEILHAAKEVCYNGE